MTISSSKWPRYLAYVAAIVLMTFLVRALAPVLAPFVAAAVLAYICVPLVDRLERRKLPRSVAVILVMTFVVILIVGLLVILVPLVIDQIAILSAKVPRVLDWIRQTALPWIAERTGVSVGEGWTKLREALARNFLSAAQLLAAILPTLGQSGVALLGVLGMLILLPVAMFFFLRDWHRFMGMVASLVPLRLLPDISALGREVDSVLGEFLRGQLAVMVSLSVFYGVGLWIVGLDGALSIGVLAGMLSFVPFVGFFIGLVLGTLSALIEFQTASAVLGVGIVFALGQVLESYWLTPKLVGDRVGLHPLGVVFAIMAFGQLLGFVGILLAVPISAGLLVLMRYFVRRYRAGTLYLD